MHTVGPRAGAPATEGLSAGPPALARVGRARALPAHARAAARRAAGGRSGWRSARRRWPAPTSRTARTDESGARHRLAFEELLLLQLAVAGRRRCAAATARQRTPAGRPRRGGGPLALVAPLRAHRRPEDARWRRSTRTSARERPMQRLLMGEVGAGKTVVALHAMLRAVENGAQAALMAPTETLAEQHHRTLDRLLGGAHAARAAHGLDPGRPAARPARRARLGRAPAGGGHARADRGPRGVPGPRRGAWWTSSTASGCASAPRSTPRPRRGSPRTRCT